MSDANAILGPGTTKLEIGGNDASRIVNCAPAAAGADILIQGLALTGAGRLQVVNLFAWRATSPRRLRRAADPIGPRNLAAVAAALRRVRSERRPGPVVPAWGIHGGHLGQDRVVLRCLRNNPEIALSCLGVTKDGHPRHPLYVPYSVSLRPFTTWPPAPRSLSSAPVTVSVVDAPR